MKGMVRLLVVIIVATTLLSIGVLGATCGGPMDPPCDICGNNIREGTEVCDGPDGCNSGQTCNAACTACETPGSCNDNGFCNPDLGETAESCADCRDGDSDGIADSRDLCPTTPYDERFAINSDGCSCSDVTCPATTGCVAYTCSYGVCEPVPAPLGTVCGASMKCTANGLCWPVCAVQPGCAVNQPAHTDAIAN